MTDVDAPIGEMPMGFGYGAALPPAWRGVSEVHRFRPQQGQVFEYGNNGVIRIPITAPGYADMQNAELQFNFRVQYTGTANANWAFIMSGGAACWIRSLKWEGPEQNELEFIDEYALLYTQWMAHCGSRAHRRGPQTIKEGVNLYENSDGLGPRAFMQPPDFAIGSVAVRQSADITLTLGGGGTVSWGPTQGAPNDVMVVSTNPAAITPPIEFLMQNNAPLTAGGRYLYTPVGINDVQRTFSIALLSAMTNTNRYIPLILMAKQTVVLVLELELPSTALTATSQGLAIFPGTAWYSIINPVLAVPVIRVPVNYSKTFRDAVDLQGMPLQLSGVTFRTTKATYPNEEITMPLGAFKCTSLKGLLIALRSSQSVGYFGAQAYTCSNLGVKQYVLQVGGTNYPQQPIQVIPADVLTQGGYRATGANLYAELLRVLGTTSDVHYGGVVNFSNYRTSFGLLGIALETFPTASGQVSSGLNTAEHDEGMQLHITGPVGISRLAVDWNTPFATSEFGQGDSVDAWTTSSVAPSFATNDATQYTYTPLVLLVTVYAQCDWVGSVLPGGSFVATW